MFLDCLMHTLWFIQSLQDMERRTPIHAAAFRGEAEIVDLLAQSGKKLSFFKGVLHLLPPKSSKISMFCPLSQNYQHLFENDTCIL